MIRFSALVLLVVLSLWPESAHAQRFRRSLRYSVLPAQSCPNGVCPIVISPPSVLVPGLPTPTGYLEPVASIQWFEILRAPAGRRVTAAEERAIRSWTRRAVRIINGNACGTGSLCGRDASSIYILTNAHVASSRIGNVVRCEALLADGSGTEKFEARVIESAYSSRTATDWALLRADARYMAGIEPIPLSTTGPQEDALTGTWGCPRCEVPQGQLVETKKLGSVWYWQPNAIGGQSGSAVIQGGVQKGLLTWTISGDGAGQLTETIFNQSARGNTDGPARVPGMIPGDVSYADVELVEGYQSEADIHNYPIWAEVEPVPAPPTDPAPGPDMPDAEKRLRDRLKERGIDWVTFISLILQLLELIQKGRG